MNKHKYSSVGRGHPVGAGSQGPAGSRGEPAPTIAAWEPRPERFENVPRFSNGESGPPLNLLSLFQAYNNATSWIEDADLEQAAQASRAAMQAETENDWSR
jgi:hypothetical protein